MPGGKIVLVTFAIDQGDILGDFLNWHLDLGIDLVLVHDIGSTDGSHDLLNDFARRRAVEWSLVQKKDVATFSPSGEIAAQARDKFHADWIILCDVDEFLCPVDDDLRTILQRADHEGVTSFNVPCFNMTGPIPAPGQRATEALTLRIDGTYRETHEQQVSGDLPNPFIFVQHPPHPIVRASAFQSYGAGAHSVDASWGTLGDATQLRFLHYPMRGYDKFEKKIRNTATFFSNNQHLESWWGWHWRRWIKLYEAGRLREEYESQFMTPARAAELLGNGTLARDETVANWAQRQPTPIKSGDA